jgi:hypothetical protein
MLSQSGCHIEAHKFFFARPQYFGATVVTPKARHFGMGNTLK